MEKFLNFEAPKTEKETELKDIEITEKEIDESIKENPEGFIGWFENLKNSIGSWPEKFFKNKTIRNAIIYTSIPFAVLKAGQLEAKAEDVVSKFVNQPAISERFRTETLEQRIKTEDLVAIENQEQKEILAQRINQELAALDKISEPFNEAAGKKAFDFSGQLKDKIGEANDYFKELLEMKSPELRQEKKKVHTRKILDGWRLNFKELAKTIPEVILAQKMSVMVHELGHEEEAMRQGAKSVKSKFNLFGGYTKYKGEIRNEAAFNVAGINADKAYGEFLVNNLREKDSPSQLLAIMALVAKSDGMFYALSTNFTETMKEHKGNDILEYAKETNTPVSELALGLTADFILDRDNWQLLNIALGKEGVKIPKATLAPMYELGEHGPIIGLKIKGIF